MINFTSVTIQFSMVLAAIATITISHATECGETWICHPTTTAPTLDGNLNEWTDVQAYNTDMVEYSGVTYAQGQAAYKCMYDDSMIYFSFEIPGEYRFDTEDNKLCHAIATMTKIGADATFWDMGGCNKPCPDNVVPTSCDSHRVDVGAHWELKSTLQGVGYSMNVVNSTGNDVTPANKDDEYAVSSMCRFDDNDVYAGNEWAGAWLHTNPSDGQFGTYVYELSRPLTTESTLTDAHFVAGETIEFGVAFWDPFETEAGWTISGHYLTGCGYNWINLKLALEGEVLTPDTPMPTTQAPVKSPTTMPTKRPCFSGESEIQVKGQGATRMDALQIGDAVLTGDGSYSIVYSFGHYSPDDHHDVLQILADNMVKALEISPNHMLRVNGKLAPASHVKVGDGLTSSDGSIAEVKTIRTLTRAKGIYAPHTLKGEFVVNGVVTSNYVVLPELGSSFEWQAFLQHFAMSPYRAYCFTMGCENERYDAEGRPTAVAVWLPFLAFVSWILGNPMTLAVVAASAYLYVKSYKTVATNSLMKA